MTKSAKEEKLVPYSVERFESENVISSGKIEPVPKMWGHVRKILGALPEAKPYPWKRKESDAFRYAARLYLRRPKSVVSIFGSGKITISARNGSDTKGSVREFKRILKKTLGMSFKVDHDVKNVVGSGVLNQGIECGVLGTVFPNSKKVFGEGYRVYVEGSEGANIAYWPSGKVLGIGFKSFDEMRTELDNQIETINENLDVIEKETKNVCFMERTRPAIISYYNLIKEVEERKGVKFTTEERVRGRYYLERFLDEKAKRKESLGTGPESMGAAALYILAQNVAEADKLALAEKTLPRYSSKHLYVRKLRQADLSTILGRTEVTIRKAKAVILETVGDLA